MTYQLEKKRRKKLMLFVCVYVDVERGGAAGGGERCERWVGGGIGTEKERSFRGGKSGGDERWCGWCG